jgi:hypothetical protein
VSSGWTARIRARFGADFYERFHWLFRGVSLVRENAQFNYGLLIIVEQDMLADILKHTSYACRHTIYAILGASSNSPTARYIQT